MSTPIQYETLRLSGVTYAVLPEKRLRELCRLAGVAVQRGAQPEPVTPESPGGWADLDKAALAERLILRRERAGVTQAELARLAGVRVETLNRIERQHANPDFGTIRKLVEALNTLEAALATPDEAMAPAKDTCR